MAPIRTALVLAALFGAPALAQTADDAFANGNYLEARDLWQAAADDGDRDARFNLGVLYDLGLGVPRDPARAFRHYLGAADAGHGEAQFNVAVMIDAGTVRAPDARAAAVWYGRAAANGVPRAAYNLGLLYLGGTGVAQNAALARYWLDAAANAVPAASDALARLEEEETAVGSDPGIPDLQGGFRVDLPDGSARAELVWTAPPGGGDSPFIVQLAELPGPGGAGGRMAAPIESQGSAVAVPLDRPEARHAWRVLRMAPGGDGYAASPWSALDAGMGEAPLPQGAVRLEVAAGDADARRLAEALMPALARNGILSRIVTVEGAVPQTRVGYAYEADAALAARVAAILPGAPQDAASAGGASTLAPGQITVALSGGLAAQVN